jgi:hypothetical protein
MPAEGRDPTLRPRRPANQRWEEPVSEAKPLGRIARRDPDLFVLWRQGVRPEVGV